MKIQSNMGASTQKEGCAYCGKPQALDGGPLAPCESCNMAAYCGEEHQKFHWKRHKMFCKPMQSKNAVAVRKLQLLPGQSDFEFIASDTYRNPKTSTSSDASTSSSNFAQQSTSSDSSSLSSNSPKSVSLRMISSNSTEPSGSPELSLATCKLAGDSRPRIRLISTDEPDIQIIENEEPLVKRIFRKRPQNSVEFKDHMLNRPYDIDMMKHLRILLSDPVRSMSLTQYDAMALRMKYIADHVIKSLNEFGWAIVDNFFGPVHCRQALGEMETLYEHGLFSPGQLVTQQDNLQPQDVRQDEIFWFDTKDDQVAEAVSLRLLVSTIDSVTAHFKDHIHPYKISSRARPMIAVYPGRGSHYVKHVDNPAKDGRCITSIYYCNEGWSVSRDGGALRLYPKSSTTPVTINPKADRLLFFFSDRRNPHEVLPTYKNRFSMTIWYYDRDEKDAAMERRRLEARKGGQSNPVLSVSSPSSSRQCIMDSSEPPAKWKIGRPDLSGPASYPGPSSLLTGSFSFRPHQFRNPNVSSSSFLSLSQSQLSFPLPCQPYLKDVSPFASARRINGKGSSARANSVLGITPSSFLDVQNDVV